MHWNVHGNIGTTAANSSAGAAAVARIVNYNQPDLFLINEVADGTTAINTAALTSWVNSNLPYLATGTFYVVVSTAPTDTQRNAAISRYPILTPFTYPDIRTTLRGMLSFQLQLAGTNRLQVFYVHLKCCSTGTSCQDKTDEAQLFGNNIAGWASTNSAPYIFSGDLNDDEQNFECSNYTLANNPLRTLRELGGLVEFKPTMLNSSEYRTWSTTALSIRFDYIWAATNRLTPQSGIIFSTMNQAASGLYTNASPSNLVNDSQTASDHFAVIANYLFPTAGGADFTVTPATAFASSGNPGGPFSPSNQVYTVNNTNTTSLTWGAGKNASWLSLSATNGTLPGNTSTNITVSINGAANALAGGAYSDTVIFSNATTGTSVGCSVNLTVFLPGQLSVSPAGGFSSSGAVGGPFSPPSQSYVLTNTGNNAINWTANNSAAWLSLSSLSGSLAGGASTSVGASLNANALAAGSYSDTIGFTNTTNGAGNTTRPVSLTVLTAGGGFFDNMENGTNGWAVTGLWHLADENTSGCVTVTAHSASHAWWYGQESTCNYRTGSSANSGNLISPSFVVPASATLTFWSWEDTEGTGTVYDQRFVSISTNAGASWLQLLQSTNDAATWYQVTINLAAYAGKNAQLRFQFNTVNGTSNRFGGWEIDDVAVAGPPVSATLSVTPATPVNSSGEQNGPFAPASQAYALTNAGSSALNWTASVANNWLTLSATAGALGAGANTIVTATTNANAAALVGGLYSNLFSFGNVTNGAGNTNLVWTLLVRDGIADAWRLQYFGHIDPRASDLSRAQDDPDGDGFTNLQEFLAGTDPTNSASAFTIISVTRDVGGVTVTWNSVPGNIYQLQYKDDIADSTWNDVDSDVNAVDTTASKLDDTVGVNSQRIYRVLLVQ